MKYLLWRKDNWITEPPKSHNSEEVESQVYADSEEQEAMAVCHLNCETLLKDFVESIGTRGFIRALDVAGGDARLAASEIFNRYTRVDIFDQCSLAVAKAQSAMK